MGRGALAKRPRAAPAPVVRAFLRRLGLSRAVRARHRHIDRSAIDEQVMADDESGIAAAEKCTRLTEFFGRLMVKKSIQTNFQINANALTATAANPAPVG